MDAPSLSLAQLLDDLSPVQAVDPMPEIRSLLARTARKIVVLDDDPTGTQTVHDVPIVTEWSTDLLADELREPGPVIYILTNSRSLPEAEAVSLNHQIITNLVQASAKTRREISIVSRSDSTLRGHFPAELDAIEHKLGRRHDAWILCPFFQDGGRLTIHDVHYVAEGDVLTPAAQTPFARDAAFGYVHSNLRDWIIEKCRGQIQREKICSLTLDDLRCGNPKRLAAKVDALTDGKVCIINAVERRDMEVAVLALMRAEASGKRFLYRTAASFVAVRAGIEPRPLLSPSELCASGGSGTLVVVGSYVPKTTEQLAHLLDSCDAERIELDARQLLAPPAREVLVAGAAKRANQTLRDGRTAVIYTSRQIVHTEGEASLAIGRTISQSLITVLKRIETRPQVLIAKGGITSSDVATDACGIRRANVMGQILPGIPVWQCGPESRHPGMPLVIFPGNVGGSDALTMAVSKVQT